MGVCDPSADGEAETAAGFGFSLAEICLIEAVKDVLAHILGHADAGVAHGYDGGVVEEEDLGADLAVGGRVSDGVVEEDAEQALEEELVALDECGFGGKVPVEHDVAGLGEVFDASTAIDQKLAEVDLLEGDLVDEVVALGEGEECVEQGGGGAALGDDLVEVFAVLVFGAAAMKRELRGGEDDGDGGSEIVGGVGGELAETGDGGVQPGEELVPGDGKLLYFVFGLRDWKPLGEIADADA